MKCNVIRTFFTEILLYMEIFEKGIMWVYLDGISLDDGLFCNVIVVHIR